MTLEEMQTAILALQGECQRLRSRESIEYLIVSYARACDRGNDPDLLAPLFTEDAAWECKGFGRYIGRERIAKALKAIAGEKIWWSLHYMISPVVTIAPDGAAATAFWYLWEAATMPEETTGAAQAYWIGATYEASLRCVDGSWLFQSMELILNMASPIHEGWVKKRFPDGTPKQPYFVYLTPGKYLWCACGKSSKAPYCDGSHGEGRIRPIEFEVKEAGLKALCGCRYSRTKPLCDGAHLNIKL